MILFLLPRLVTEFLCSWGLNFDLLSGKAMSWLDSNDSQTFLLFLLMGMRKEGRFEIVKNELAYGKG